VQLTSAEKVRRAHAPWTWSIDQTMPVEIGEVEAIFRYPVKSMRGEPLEDATLGWHGLEGDRRLAFRRLDDRGGFPWLTASKLPDLILFTPKRREEANGQAVPTHVRTPDGEEMPLFGEALAAEVGRRSGAPVEMMQLKHGIFDDASIALITSATVREIGRLAGTSADVRRFRPNIVVRSTRAVPFEEGDWVGGVIIFGAADEAPAVTATMRDARCAMVNIDPDEGSLAPEVLKAVVRANQNNAGIYGTVTRIGRLAVGQTVVLHR
jgi:MOSC domain-containing protein